MKKIIFLICIVITLGSTLAGNVTKPKDSGVIIKNKAQILENIKNSKIEKISLLQSKLSNIVSKAESINYDTRELKVYINNLSNIKLNLEKSEKIIEARKYNMQLKGTISGIRQELSDLKNFYKSL